MQGEVHMTEIKRVGDLWDFAGEVAWISEFSKKTRRMRFGGLAKVDPFPTAFGSGNGWGYSPAAVGVSQKRQIVEETLSNCWVHIRLATNQEKEDSHFMFDSVRPLGKTSGLLADVVKVASRNQTRAHFVVHRSDMMDYCVSLLSEMEVCFDRSKLYEVNLAGGGVIRFHVYYGEPWDVDQFLFKKGLYRSDYVYFDHAVEVDKGEGRAFHI